MYFKKWLLNEVSKELVRQVKDAANNKDKPFQHIFKNNDRIILPYESFEKDDHIPLEIQNKIKKDGYSIDFQNGLISKDKIIPPQFQKPNQKPAKIQIKMGKYILEKGDFNQDEKNWWTHQGNPIKSLEVINNKEKYAVVISRHPIDVIRMSDHDNWTSCHSPSGSYFHCAVSEAKNSGAIAYVVTKDDLSKINIKDDEIFLDKDRDVSGVEPLARLRIRLFKNKKDDHELAMPEDRVYGLNLKGLQDTIRKWSFENQKELLQNRPKMKDYELMGGSYQDTTASELFNKFFDDDQDRGEADYGGEENEFQSMLDTYETESEEIQRQYNDKSDIVSFNYSVDMADDHPYVYYSASIKFELPNQKLISKYGINKNHLRDWLHDHDIYAFNDVDVTQKENNIDVSFNVYDEQGHLDPDSFRDFCESIISEVKNKETDLHNSLYNFLVKQGFLATSNTVNTITTVEKDDNKTHELNNLKNFKTIVNSNKNNFSSGMTISLQQPITITEFKETEAKDPEKFETTVKSISLAVENKIKTEIKNTIASFFEKIEANEKKQLKLFNEPEFQVKIPSPVNTKQYIDVSLQTNVDPYTPIRNHKGELQRAGWNKPPNANIKINFSLPVQHLDADEKTNEIIDMAKMMDQNFESLKSQILKVSNAILQPYILKYFN